VTVRFEVDTPVSWDEAKWISSLSTVRNKTQEKDLEKSLSLLLCFLVLSFSLLRVICKRWIYLCNRPWRPIRLWDVEAPTFSRQSAHRWRWGCQPYAPAALYPQGDSWYSFLLEAESTTGPQWGWKDWVNWKTQWPRRESNPQPSGLYHSASTNYASACRDKIKWYCEILYYTNLSHCVFLNTIKKTKTPWFWSASEL
jgi:hypothetical protein